MNGYYAILKHILEEHGCYKHREARGSHELWFSPMTQQYFPVSVSCQSRHTANGILKQAGIKKKV